jgi:hypothetical protein
MNVNRTFGTCSRLYAKERAQGTTILAVGTLIEIYNRLCIGQKYLCVSDVWNVARVSRSRATRRPQTTEISGKAGSRHHSRSPFSCAKFRLQEISSCRHAQAMSLKSTSGGKSISFQWRIKLPMERLLQIQSLNRAALCVLFFFLDKFFLRIFTFYKLINVSSVALHNTENLLCR